MPNSLIEELPKIIKRGKREANKILEGLSDENRLTLQTNELVLPSKDESGYFKGTVKTISEDQWFNKLIYGDNLFAMQALLYGDENTSSLRGGIDLIYIDPPYDSKADYRTTIQLPNSDIEQRPTVLEQFAYKDTWKNGTASYLEMMVPRLILMRELLSNQGSIFVHIDWHIGHYLKVIMDNIFGKENFKSEIIWKRTGGHHISDKRLDVMTDTILYYSKTDDCIFNPQYEKLSEEEINEKFPHTEEETGRRFNHEKLEQSSNASSAGEIRVIQGKELTTELGWRWSQETFDQRLKENPYIIYWTNSGRPRYKNYADEYKGRDIGNLWDDVNP